MDKMDTGSNMSDRCTDAYNICKVAVGWVDISPGDGTTGGQNDYWNEDQEMKEDFQEDTEIDGGMKL